MFDLICGSGLPLKSKLQNIEVERILTNFKMK